MMVVGLRAVRGSVNALHEMRRAAKARCSALDVMRRKKEERRERREHLPFQNYILLVNLLATLYC